MLKNSLYNFIGAAFRLGVSICTVPILIRFLGLEEYGLWTIVSSVIAIVSLAEAGISVSTTFFLSRDLANKDTISFSQTLTASFSSMFLLATTSATILWCTYPYIVILFPKLSVSEQQIAISGFQIGAFVLWVKLFQRIFVGVEQAYQRYGIFNLISTIQIGLVNLGMILVAYKGGNILGLMYWQIISNTLVLIIHIVTFRFLLRGMNARFCWDRGKCQEIIHYSLMSWLVSIGSAMFSQVDKLIVGSILGTNILGIYAAITNITSQINTLSSLPVQPIMPQLSNLLASRADRLNVQKFVYQAFHINIFVAIILGINLMGIAPFLLSLLLSNMEVSEYTNLFYIALIIYTLYSSNAVGYYLLFGTNNVDKCFKIQLISGIFSLGLIALGTTIWGLSGAILGNVGYLGVFALTYEGMKALEISHKTWLGWLSFIAPYFFAMVITTVIIPDSFVIRGTLIFIQSSFLSVWFIRKYRSDFKFKLTVSS